MAIALKFWLQTAIWAAVRVSVFTILSLFGGGGADAVAHIPGWLGFGCSMA